MTEGLLSPQQNLEALTALPGQLMAGLPMLSQQTPQLMTNAAATQIQAPLAGQNPALQTNAASNPLGNIMALFSQLMSGFMALFQPQSTGASATGGTDLSQLLSVPGGDASADGVQSNNGVQNTAVMAKRPDDPNHVTRKVPGRKVAHSTPYYKANSPQGLESAHAKGYKWADLDFRVTKDGVPVNIHGAPEKAFLNGKKIEDMTWDQVSKLRHDGYRIHTAQEMFAKAKDLGMNIEFEAKGSKAFQSSAAWNSVASAAQQAWGNDWQQHVQVKTLTNLTGGYDAAQNRLASAHDAGFTTIMLVRDGDTNRMINDPAIDYVRGSSRKFPK